MYTSYTYCYIHARNPAMRPARRRRLRPARADGWHAQLLDLDLRILGRTASSLPLLLVLGGAVDLDGLVLVQRERRGSALRVELDEEVVDLYRVISYHIEAYYIILYIYIYTHTTMCIHISIYIYMYTYIYIYIYM